MITDLYHPIRTLFRDLCQLYDPFDDRESSTEKVDRDSSNDSHALSIVFVTFMICLAMSFTVCVWAMANEIKKRKTDDRDSRVYKDGNQKSKESKKMKEIPITPQPCDISTILQSLPAPTETSDYSTLDSTASLLR